MITITDNRITRATKFGLVAVGDTFLLGSTVYIKVERFNVGNNHINAICLSNGKCYLFSNDKEIVLVDVELLINNRK